MLAVSNIMQRDVVALHPETTLGEAVELLCAHHVSAAPVVSDGSRLVGIISEFALMDVLFDPALRETPVSQYMTVEVHTLDEKDSLAKVVHLFALYGVRLLPVVHDGQLAGIVSRRDLLIQSSSLAEPLAEPLDGLLPQLFESAERCQLLCEGACCPVVELLG